MLDANETLVRKYLLHRSTGLLTNSLRGYGRDLLHFAEHLGEQPLTEVDAEDIIRYVRERMRDPNDPSDTRPWSVRTARRQRSALNQFYAWLERSGLVEQNPVFFLELPRFDTEAPDRCDRSHVHLLFEHIETRIATEEGRRRDLYILDAAVYRLCYHWALRISEATHLRRSQIRSVGGELRARVVKKGNKVKTYPIVGVVADAYHRWMQLRGGISPKNGSEDYVFVHPWKRLRITRKRGWQRLRQITEEAGLPSEVVEEFTPHSFRHSKAYHMIEDGYPITAVQSVLDHSNVATTNVYVRDDEEARLRALRDSSRGG